MIALLLAYTNADMIYLPDFLGRGAGR